MYPISKGLLHGESITANNKLFASNLTSTNFPSTFRVQLSVETAAVVSVVITRGSNEVTVKLNGGEALLVDTLYSFDILVNYGDDINISVNSTTDVYCRVHEIPIGGLMMNTIIQS